MRYPILAAVSAVALVAAGAITVEAAEGQRSGNALTRGLNNAGNALSNAAERVAASAENAYESIRAAIITDDDVRPGSTYDYVVIDTRNTVNGMIGRNVVNSSGENLADVEDIIFDRDGKAQLIVVSSGGFLGIGEKEAAFSYDDAVRLNAEGDVIMPLSAAAIENAAEFSYDTQDTRDNVRVIPAGGYSAKTLLRADIVDPSGRKVANVRDIFLSDGNINRVIIGFGDVMGVGGDQAAVAFDSMRLTQAESTAQFHLSSAQAAQLENFRGTATRSQ